MGMVLKKLITSSNCTVRFTSLAHSVFRFCMARTKLFRVDCPIHGTNSGNTFVKHNKQLQCPFMPLVMYTITRIGRMIIQTLFDILCRAYFHTYWTAYIMCMIYIHALCCIHQSECNWFE